jgi:hypothetical protein
MLTVAYLPLWSEPDPWQEVLLAYRLVVHAGD